MALFNKKVLIATMMCLGMIWAETSARLKKEDKGITRSNLRVIPRNISDEQLLSIMREINTALGVKCGYCHQDIPGQVTKEGHPAHDFASDNKIQKRIARKMMRMTKDINEKLADIGDGEFERINCVTCHRGQTQPSFTLDTVQLKHIR